MFATQILPDNDFVSENNDHLEIVGFLNVENKEHEIRKGENKIGRDPSICSVVVENYAVSKLHAIIECEGIDDTFIFDVGSTNQTRLGKKCLKPHCRYKIESGCEITLGNVVAKFDVLSDTEKSTLKTVTFPDSGENTINSEGVSKVDDDIFELSTQVNNPQPCRNITITKFESVPKNFQIFQLPITSAEQKQYSLEKPKSYLDSVTQFNLHKGKSPTPHKFNFCGFEDSSIFSLSTQCQISLDSVTIKETKLDNESMPNDGNNEDIPSNGSNKGILNDGNFEGIPNDGDKIKSLLNDGQDDVLCIFMSMHSPNEQKKTIKAESKAEENMYNKPGPSKPSSNCSQEKSNDKKEIEQLEDLLLNESFGENFCCSTQENFCMNSEDDKVNSLENYNERLLKKEQFSKIQVDFITDISKSPKSNGKPEDLSQNSYNSHLEITSEEEMANMNEDFIVTQEFRNLERRPSIDLNSVVVLNENLKVKTEIIDGAHDFDFQKKNICEVIKKNVRKIQKTPSFVFEESSDEETQCYVPSSVGSVSLRGDDSISAQEQNFKTKENSRCNEDIDKACIIMSAGMPQSREKNGIGLENSLSKDQDENCEDFIATQTLYNSSQEIRTHNSKENSPDLLSFEYSHRKIEDLTETQVFEAEEHKNKKKLFENFSKTIQSIFSRRFTSENESPPATEHTVRPRTSDLLISTASGDETESDLENSVNNIHKTLNLDSYLISIDKNNDKENKTDVNIFDLNEETGVVKTETNEDRSSSYVFELEQESESELIIKPSKMNVESKNKKCTFDQLTEVNFCDSDTTDCEEIDANNSNGNSFSFNQLMNKMVEDETRVLKLTLIKNFVEKSKNPDSNSMFGKGSPKCESVTNTSSENELNKSQGHLPPVLAAQEANTALEKMLKKSVVSYISEKIDKRTCDYKEIPSSGGNDITERGTFVDTSIKRIRNRDTTYEPVPLKKSKTSSIICKGSEISIKTIKNKERAFSKLCQAHDMAQIQTTRTRNSTKELELELTRNKNNTESFFKKPRWASDIKKEIFKRHHSEVVPSVSSKVESNNLFNTVRRNDTTPSSSQEFETDPKLTSCNSINRILRSSRAKSEGSPVNYSFTSKSVKLRRSYRTKNEVYFKNSRVNIVFTGFDCEILDKIISELGGRKIDDLSLGEVVVTDRVRRTVKFLCAIGLGLPITSPEWLFACRKEKRFLNPWDYILKEDESEEKWGFNLKSSLEQSKKKKLLEGFSVFATENAKPPVKDLLAIVECCGGTPLPNVPEEWPKKTIIVSCMEDKESWPLKKFRHIKIVHYEFVLSGVLKQKIDFRTYKLR